MSCGNEIGIRIVLLFISSLQFNDLFWGNNTYDVPNAASVPFGMSVDGARRSPLILIPDSTPVIVGKNIPNTRNHV